MAAVKGVNRTLITAGGESQLLSGQVDARVKVMYDTYVPLGTEAAGSTIAMGGLIPTGARIWDVQVRNAAQNSSVTLAVGDSDTSDRYAAAYAADSVLGNPITKVGGVGYVVGTATGDNQILITTAGATLGADDTIKCAIFYSID